MEAQVDWITANRVTENIIYVGHLGDLKDVGACTNATVAWPSLASPSTEWEIVRDAFDELDTAGIPYGVVPGNHDFDQINPGSRCPNYTSERPLTEYNGEFPPSSFPVTNYGSRLPGSNEDNFTIASSGGVDFLFINLGYHQDAGAAGGTPDLVWAETLMTTYPNHIAIVTSHFLVDCNASTTGGGAGANGSCAGTPDNQLSTYGNNVFDHLKAYPNLFMMIGGHRFGESYVAMDRSASGMNPVHVVLANYQHLLYSSTNFETVLIPGPADGSSGYFKLMRFDMDSMTVDMMSLSPTLAANAGIAGGPSVLPVLSNAARPTTVFSTRNIDPNIPANLVDGGGNPTLHTQSVSNLVNVSFNGYVSTGSAGSTPDAFSFVDLTDVAFITAFISNSITVTGIDTAVDISVGGGQYSINGGAFTGVAGTVNNGQSVRVRVTSSSSISTTTSATLTIGGVSDVFSATTVATTVDSDNDFIEDHFDNCPFVPNGPIASFCATGSDGSQCSPEYQLALIERKKQSYLDCLISQGVPAQDANMGMESGVCTFDIFSASLLDAYDDACGGNACNGIQEDSDGNGIGNVCE